MASPARRSSIGSPGRILQSFRGAAPGAPGTALGLPALGALTASYRGRCSPIVIGSPGADSSVIPGSGPRAPGTALGPGGAGRVGGLARGPGTAGRSRRSAAQRPPPAPGALTASLAGARYRWAPTSLGLLRAPRRCWVCRRPLLRWRRRAAVTVGRAGARLAVLGVLAALLVRCCRCCGSGVLRVLRCVGRSWRGSRGEGGASTPSGGGDQGGAGRSCRRSVSLSGREVES